MVASPEVDVDTSAFMAFLDRSDTHHALFSRLFALPPKLLTTPLVIAEGHAWFLRRYDRTRALQFLSFIECLTPLEICPCGLEEQTAAAKMLRRFPDQGLTMADAAGLHLMRARRVSTCWSTDFHLGLEGAVLVVHQH